jgi:hypothetical protein
MESHAVVRHAHVFAQCRARCAALNYQTRQYQMTTELLSNWHDYVYLKQT